MTQSSVTDSSIPSAGTPPNDASPATGNVGQTQSLWQRYVAFWNEQESPQSLALCRITFGLAVVFNGLEQLLNSNPLELYADPAYGGIFSYQPQGFFSLFQWLPSTAVVVYVLLGLYVMGGVLLTIGLFSRAAALLCLVLQMSLNARFWMYRFDGDIVYQVFLYLFVLAPAGAYASMDARWRGRGRASIPAWPRRLIMAQLMFIYVRTGIVKMGSTWSLTDGYSALYYALNLPGLARWPGTWLLPIYPMSQLATFIAKGWEITFFMVPLSLYFQRRITPNPLRRLISWHHWRTLYLLIGCIMHCSLVVLMNLGMFPFVMMSLYPSYLRPEEAARCFPKDGLSRPSAEGSSAL